MSIDHYEPPEAPPKPRATWLRGVIAVIGRWRWLVFPALGVLAVLAVFWGADRLGEEVGDAIVQDTVPPGQPVVVVIPGGSSARQIAELLEDADVVDVAADFERVVRSTGVASELKAGSYELTTGMEAIDIVAVVVAGPAPLAVFDVTVIEGFAVERILASLAGQTAYVVADYEAALLDGSVSSALLPETPTSVQDWEGLLFPDTYEFDDRDTPDEILQRLADTMVRRVDAVDWSFVEQLGFDRYQGIVVASLIEREARLDEDRPLIGSVIYNRLDIDQRLQIDATVLYAIGEQKAVITVDDLEFESPYNTYRNEGLPPTPIASPGFASLVAASAPANTEYFYYVLTDLSGKHSFAATFEEFQVLKEQAKAEGVIPLRLLLLGDPVAHSRSPAIHQAAFDASGIAAIYCARRVDGPGCEAAVGAMRAGRLQGGNVTMPHKSTVAGLCDELTPDAARTRAVNTLVSRGGVISGHLTDVEGIRRAWGRAGLPAAGPVHILGSGGAAAAALVALEGRPMVVSARRERAAAELMDRVGVAGELFAWGQPVPGATVVNATPIGMRGETLPDRVLDAAAGLFEMAYGSEATPATRVLRRTGAPVAEGREMLLAQAMASFTLWTGHPAPEAIMRARLGTVAAAGSDGRST